MSPDVSTPAGFTHPTDCPPACAKSCTKCGANKPCTTFYADKRQRCGLDSWCKACRRIANDAYLKERPDVVAKVEAGRWARRWQDPVIRARELARQKRWRDANAEWRINYSHRRRAAKSPDTVSDLTKQQWDAIKQTYRYRCAYCGRRLPSPGHLVKGVKLTMEHVIPQIRRGAHTWTNVVPACGTCNFRKRDRDAPDFQPILIL